MPYDSTAAALLHTLTQDDVHAALEQIRSNTKQHICPEGRMGVYRADSKNASFAIKFVDEDSAEDHLRNTEMFHYFEMPYTPCVALPLKKDFDNAPFAMNAKSNYNEWEDITHVVVMPYAFGMNAQKLYEARACDPVEQDQLFKNILSYGTEICLAHAWDCKKKNVIVRADVNKAADGAAYTLHPAQFTFIDAEYGLVSQGYRAPDELDVEACFKTMKEEYLDHMSGDMRQFSHNMAMTMYHKADIWSNKLKTDFTIKPPQKRPNLQDMLIARAGFVQDYVMTQKLV